MNNIYTLLILLFLSIGTASSQRTAIIKGLTKHITKEIVTESNENVVQKGTIKVGKHFTQKAVAEQTIKNIARHKLYTTLKEEGCKSLIEYANKKAYKKVTNHSLSKLSKQSLSKQSTYQQSLISLRDGKNYIKRTWIRLQVKSKDQYITAKEYMEALSKSDINFKLGYGKNSQVLRENMLKIMSPKTRKLVNSNGNQAHHIIGNRTPKAAAILKKYGIDINDPMNGIFLPSNGDSGLKGTVHLGGHTQDYYNYVENLFLNCKSKQDCYDVLDKIKADLYNGKIKLYDTNKHKVNNTFTNKTAA